MTENIKELLGQSIQLELVDIGASGPDWESYQSLRESARLLRFDPDSRDFRQNPSSGRKEVCINKAVTESTSKEIEIFLTESPYCSSTLEPDKERLSNYPYVDLFEVKQKCSVSSVTLEEGIRFAGFKRPDWIKLDTQGTELRIMKSLPKATLDRILVCEIEASIYPHYKQADTIGDIMNFFEAEDFWVVKVEEHWNTRRRKELNDELNAQFQGFDLKVFKHFTHKEPTTYELFYARTLKGCKKRGYSKDDYLRLYLSHFALGTFEYCIEILDCMIREFGPCETTQRLRELSISTIRDQVAKNRIPYLVESMKFRIGRLLTKA